MIFSKNSGEIAAASAGSAIIKDINAMQGFGNMDVLCMERGKLKGCCTAMCSSPFVQRTHIDQQSWTGRPCWCPALPRMPLHRCAVFCRSG